MADHRHPDAPPNGSLPAPDGPSSGLTSKRQRRPSVRLGEIGEQPAAAIPFESYIRRCKQYNIPLPTFPGPHADDPDAPRKAKARRGTSTGPGPGPKRPRSSWAPRAAEDGAAEAAKAEAEAEEGNCSEELRWGDSGSPMREQSVSDRVGVRVRGVKEAEEPSETNGRGWGKDDPDTDADAAAEGGVRSWLSGLGLARYAPVFEIHEVDEEVLPMLTLEDLKEMGINAVGTRRKMFSAIQKLGKGSA